MGAFAHPASHVRDCSTSASAARASSAAAASRRSSRPISATSRSRISTSASPRSRPNYTTGHEVWLGRGPLAEAIRASYALPGVFEPLRIGGRWLMDGALVNPVPVSAARALGGRMVAAVNLQSDVSGRGTVVQSIGASERDQEAAEDLTWFARMRGARRSGGEPAARRPSRTAPAFPPSWSTPSTSCSTGSRVRALRAIRPTSPSGRGSPTSACSTSTGPRSRSVSAKRPANARSSRSAKRCGRSPE
ncbi:patatin-like phospholipase family protein [Chenggangzhangella methanolivorans]|uniref:Patatin-like phospholipase family protein n=1 Tax=Chenggangzhangella methanolivorans TaxID=1437009 RepID=A0A9E6RAE2_9HYPH|nr:patatin-like phospholipase family protein [Chenggangzhangella methanolivorans]